MCTQCVCSVCAVCVQCVCSTRVMSLHVQDTVCAVRMHLEAVRGALSTEHMCSVCTSGEHQDECSGCAAYVQGVRSERASSVQCTFRECTSGVQRVCSEANNSCAACAGRAHPCVQCVQDDRVPGVQCTCNECASDMQSFSTTYRQRAGYMYGAH